MDEPAARVGPKSGQLRATVRSTLGGMSFSHVPPKRAARPVVVILLATAAATLVGAIAFVAFAAIAFDSPWSNEPGEALAARIRAAGSPLVQRVEFRPLTMIDPPEVHVIVGPGVTAGQVETLWCSVVEPAGGGQFEGNLGALIYDQQGNWLSSNVTC